MPARHDRRAETRPTILCPADPPILTLQAAKTLLRLLLAVAAAQEAEPTRDQTDQFVA